MKLCWYGETPYIETGAGQVAKHLLPVFQAYFERIHLVAINQWWEQSPLPEGLTITLAPEGDLFNPRAADEAIRALDYDVLFLTTDLNRISALIEAIQVARDAGKDIVMYAAMDTHIFAPHFWQVLCLADRPIVFSEWCKRQALEILPELTSRLEVIYHGCEPEVFYPLTRDERREQRARLFHITDDSTFLVLNINRNQVRKDLARTMAAFRLFHREQPNSLLYLHAKRDDLGGSLVGQAEALGLRAKGEHANVIFAPDGYHEASGISREELNHVYNAADVFLTTSTGEGWGLTTTEAMAASLPVIAPDNTVFPEQLGKMRAQWLHYQETERGLLVESGGPDLWAIPYGVSDWPRELCSVQGAVAALNDVYNYRDAAYSRALLAREWTKQHTWIQVQEQWRAILENLLIKEKIA